MPKPVVTPKPAPTVVHKTPDPSPSPTPTPTEDVVVSDPLEFTPQPSTYSSTDPDGLTSPLEIPAPSPAPSPAPGPTPAPTKELSPEEKKRLNSDLRAQLELANKSKAEIEEQMRKTVSEKEAELERVRKEREDFENRFKDVEGKYAELNRTIGMERPEESEEVRNLIAPWNKEMDALAQDITVAGGDGGRFKQELGKMIAMARELRDPNADGFDQKRDEFNRMVSAYGQDHAKDVRRFVFNGIELQDKARSVMQDLTRNAGNIRHQREMQAFTAIVKDYEKDEAGFFNPAPEVKETDPFNAEVLVTELLNGSDAGKQRMTAIKKFIRFTDLPLPPVPEDELAKMSEQDAATFLENRLRNHQAAIVRRRKMMPAAMAAHALLPSLVKRNKELEDQIATLRGNTPSPKPGEEHHDPGDDAVDVKTFTPSNPKLDELKPELR
jgi:hypothetical protein